MTTCEDCIHCQVCDEQKKINHRVSKSVCKHFKDKSQIIELPCKVGDVVYCLATPCGGCPCYNEVMCEDFIERCRRCNLWEIIECKFSIDLYDEFGINVFLTHEEAKKALKEREQNDE